MDQVVREARARRAAPQCAALCWQSSAAAAAGSDDGAEPQDAATVQRPQRFLSMLAWLTTSTSTVSMTVALLSSTGVAVLLSTTAAGGMDARSSKRPQSTRGRASSEGGGSGMRTAPAAAPGQQALAAGEGGSVGRRGWQLRVRADPPPAWRRRRERAGRQGPSGAPAAGPTANRRPSSSIAVPQAGRARLQRGAASEPAAAAPDAAMACRRAFAQLAGEPGGVGRLRRAPSLGRATHCASPSGRSSRANRGTLLAPPGAL